ncbi:MAG: glycosyltransferase family 2 protein [Chlorobium sp.]|uniref:glycosyltransferase family 2 protein n=1 Tax=Chlorobium sp. TaxID=1095 RepID=UPI0025C542D6|nr:glycosyltransferase family 2 protein [Chlorobium sp.]MCF8215916.1 glycosyltransferase family 2 protein [Chlorobium sp.]MCF8270814.1 glycosyltransferase family 2 protein [Chlorobium sp.]MCF8287126.1 glycosyltransferase family 2 protein [Chlorobium sp.]MCF8290783.1 glycosyltransferase family 2 protein [Chlorobium sp.]MCF8384887.1 glycosyltransferase family 2 protein [Chlorobium sp.]
MKLSVVIPVMNEAENIRPLFEALDAALRPIEHEIILVDDGSSDGTVAVVTAAAPENVQLIVLNKNYGQTTAMAAGIDHAKGELIATMDGDLQNDPEDIPMMIRHLEAHELDVVAGRRTSRKDGMMMRKIPSALANTMIRNLTDVHIRDYGCTLKVFRKDVAKNLGLYGELHRFIPVLVQLYGAKMEEVDVRHHPRKFGRSKYGIGRTFKVLSDLLFMVFFQKWGQKPMHLFGTLGFLSFFLGIAVNLYLLALKILGEEIGGRPMLSLGIILTFIGIQLITTGFVAEFIMRTYYESQNKKPYIIRKIVGKP